MLDVDVVICAFSWERFDRTLAAVESVLAQRPEPGVIVVVDHNPSLMRALAERVPTGVQVVSASGAQGLGGAWNTGVDSSTAAVVAFLDDDAIAEPGWLAALVGPLQDPQVLATGGVAEPIWSGSRPKWLADEWLWVVGCTYAGMPRTGAVRNVLGCNMAFRASVFAEIGGFLPGIGRLGKRPLGGGETEMCIRASQRWPDRAVIVVDDAVVRHHVTYARQTFGYFLRRCFFEGVSKALLWRLVGADALRTEAGYVIGTLRSAMLRDVCDLRRVGAPTVLGRLLATVAGVVASFGGFSFGLLASTRRRGGAHCAQR